MTLSRSCSRTEREENRQTGPMGHWLLEEIMASGRDYGFWKRLWLSRKSAAKATHNSLDFFSSAYSKLGKVQFAHRWIW